jgi:NTP pyrophosphatase (non-canonical NTP hydrolase)
MDYKNINNEIKKFVTDREWEKFHSPKNISMALSVEASELVEIFQWQSNDEYKNNAETKNKVKDEVSDIFYYLVRMCQKMDIDLETAFYEKMKKNKLKYPIDKYKGKST